jgi:hypothetical protein
MGTTIDQSEKIADTVVNSAALLGISVSQFRRVYLHTGLIVPVDLGGRSPSIILADLRAAVAKRQTEQADPAGPKPPPRSSGAVLAARNQKPNPYGRHGKPPAPAAAKAVRK